MGMSGVASVPSNNMESPRWESSAGKDSFPSRETACHASGSPADWRLVACLLVTQGRAHVVPGQDSVPQPVATSFCRKTWLIPARTPLEADAIKAKSAYFFPLIQEAVLGRKNLGFKKNRIRLNIMLLPFYNEKPGLGERSHRFNKWIFPVLKKQQNKNQLVWYPLKTDMAGNNPSPVFSQQPSSEERVKQFTCASTSHSYPVPWPAFLSAVTLSLSLFIIITWRDIYYCGVMQGTDTKVGPPAPAEQGILMERQSGTLRGLPGCC